MAGFDEAGTEYVVLETGLGGRLDATNSISRPFACILTSIGLDYTEILGDTLEKIAAEKAGISKRKFLLFLQIPRRKAVKKFEKRAEELGCPCKKIGKYAYEILEIQKGTLRIFSGKCVLWRYYMEIAKYSDLPAGKCDAGDGNDAYSFSGAGKYSGMERGTCASEVGRQDGRNPAGFLCRWRT